MEKYIRGNFGVDSPKDWVNGGGSRNRVKVPLLDAGLTGIKSEELDSEEKPWEREWSNPKTYACVPNIQIPFGSHHTSSSTKEE